MPESNNRNTASGRGKRKRFPLFSIALVVCYIAVAAIFIVYGFGEGRTADEDTAEPVAETIAPPVEEPVISQEPVVDEIVRLPPAVKVKGIYVGAWFAVDKDRMDNYIDLCESTEINTLVLDVKEDHGYVTFPTDSELFPTSQGVLMEDMGELVADLKSRGIYTIARVVCFKDPIWASRNPHFALRDGAGNQWTDRSGTGWLNPYMRENWDYIAEICLEAARLGFEEIQLDYVRFPADGRLSEIDYGAAGEAQTRTEVIAEFMEFIRDTMLKVGLRTSADVFGIIALSNTDAGIIGQDLDLLFPAVHYLSPMIYPSHFANKRQNEVGQVINGVLFEAPDTEPYEVVYHALQHFIRRRDPDDPDKAIIRPFLQNFTADYLGEGYYLPYGPEEVRAQIQAVYDAGLEEWILWNHISVYSEAAFRNP